MRIDEILSDDRGIFVIIFTAAGTYVGKILEWIPHDIGQLSFLVTSILGSLTLYMKWRVDSVKIQEGSIDIERKQIELDIIKNDLSLQKKRMEEIYYNGDGDIN